MATDKKESVAVHSHRLDHGNDGKNALCTQVFAETEALGLSTLNRGFCKIIIDDCNIRYDANETQTCISKQRVTIELPHGEKIAPFHWAKSIGYGLIEPYQTSSSSSLPSGLNPEPKPLSESE